MRKMRMTLAAILAVLLVTGASRAQGGEVRFDARLRTPGLSVRIGNTPGYGYEVYRYRELPVRKAGHRRIARADRRIAARLSFYTGVPERKLIGLRRMGYSWMEIGIWLRLPAPVLRAARHAGGGLPQVRRGRCPGH